MSTSQGDKFEYPPIPEASGGETRIQCPFCFKALGRKELEAGDDYWKHHSLRLALKVFR
ncbi:hypothetical protein B0T26DRAFT_721857 [Lasiosphaeria miniovina]|uniref:Uncharacterized protein n=1 Tax=Lasiosphaeria miniovina TaxID=1954250 RepID=A0AA40DNC0_9PEZI|nr:uncharacterized protein B0T26DRAFT_721857 [Lasiosphaeria miniovina]KAK0709520.1 hypothetical protein B0T26DRAFT_721857 [Lasiosphaeria miniovina]